MRDCLIQICMALDYDEQALGNLRSIDLIRQQLENFFPNQKISDSVIISAILNQPPQSISKGVLTLHKQNDLALIGYQPNLSATMDQSKYLPR